MSTLSPEDTELAEAAEEAMRLYRSTIGKTKESARIILEGLRVTFTKLASRSKEPTYWELIERKIVLTLA